MRGTQRTRAEQLWEWADHGACRDVPDLFYNADTEPKAARRRKEARAKALCATCPVLERCREHALANNELYGVWGGMTEAERHRLAGRARTG